MELFAQNGAFVYANAREPGCIDSYCNELTDKYSTCVCPVYFDVTNNDALRDCFVKINKEHKRLDILVNNAGVMRDALIGMISTNMMNEVFSVNVFAVISMIQYATKLMAKNKSGSIINLS